MKFNIILFVLFILNSFSIADDSEGILNKLLAPGPLMEGHKKLEGKDCLKCHEAGKGISEANCLSCHKEIKLFLDSKKGFHGLASQTQTCIQCHADHKGRALDSTLFDDKTFEHFKMTGYGLEGKHAKIKCQECHTEKRKNKPIRPNDIRFLGTKATSCKSCHKKDDIHFFKGEFGAKDCIQCHGSNSWKENIKFSHDKDTKYKLIERHSELKCNDCHLKDKRKKIFQYQWEHLAQTKCLSCHQDFHKNKLSRKYANGECATCHNQTKWTIGKFDHEITGYSLLGKHQEAGCIDCHQAGAKVDLKKEPKMVKDLNFTGLKKPCLFCHQDVHKFGKIISNKFGDINQCSKCHEESSWKKIHYFDHNTQTKYAIDGKHLELKCNDCHRPNKKRIDPKVQIDSKSKTQAQQNLNLDIKIPTYHWAQLGAKTCETCHRNPHLGEFSKDMLNKKCTVCHVTEDWFIQKSDAGFDHNKTRFPLTGSHKGAKCNDCHGSVGKKKFKFSSVNLKFCMDCHQNVHEKQFKGKWNTQDCSQCHGTDNFFSIEKFDHQLTGYILKGEHEKVKCKDCHFPSKEKYLLKWPNVHSKNHDDVSAKVMSTFYFPELKSKSCRQCHDDYHNNQLSQNCGQCHSEKSWKSVAFDHNKQSKFPLNAKHADLKCEKCHTTTGAKVKFKNELKVVVKYKPLSTQCADCHKDPHKGNFGKSCQECHTEKNWKSTKDFHKNFTLSGVHYTLECSECHRDRKKLAGLSQQCFACHQKDDVHNGSTPDCKLCHTQQFWEITSFRHSLTKFPLRGAHRVIECTDCHLNGVYKGLSSSCVACHLKDYQAFPSNHTSGNVNCTDCHHHTFTFKDVKK